MSLPPDLLWLAERHRRRQQELARRLARLMASLWRRTDPAAALASWRSLTAASALQATTMAQLAAADAATAYVGAALALQDSDPTAGQIFPSSLAGIASDGRPLGSLLEQPASAVDALVAGGMPSGLAMRAGAERLARIVVTQVADAARVATGVATVGAPGAAGYVRMLTPPSCSRCAILAGRWYAANRAFDRHPRCDCVHIPAAESLRGRQTSPQDYFDSLSPAEQDRVFTKAGARAIRDGADITQVVNVRRGAAGLAPAGGRLTAEELRALRGGRERGQLQRVDAFGQQLFVTTEGARGRVPRLMPESIYEIAKDREEAVRLLRRYGYLL